MTSLHGCVAPDPTAQEEPGARALVRLNAALRQGAPPCADNPLFTRDGLTPDERDDCFAICEGCPVAGLCGAYADAANVRAGYWAGHSYTPRGKQ